MSNKYGDKVKGIQPGKVEPKKEEPKQEKVEALTKEVKEQQIKEPSRPVSNFSRTTQSARPSSEQVAGDRVKMGLTEFLLRVRKATNIDEEVKARMMCYSLFKSIVNNPDFATFSKEWTSVLNFFNANKEDLNLITVNRGKYRWTLDSRDQELFVVLNILAVMTADPNKRRKPVAIGSNEVISHASRVSKEAAYNLGAYYTFAE